MNEKAAGEFRCFSIFYRLLQRENFSRNGNRNGNARSIEKCDSITEKGVHRMLKFVHKGCRETTPLYRIIKQGRVQ